MIRLIKTAKDKADKGADDKTDNLRRGARIRLHAPDIVDCRRVPSASIVVALAEANV